MNKRVKIFKTINILLYIFSLFILLLCIYITLENKIICNKIYEDNISIIVDKNIDINDEYGVKVIYTGDNSIKCSLDNINYIDIQDCSFKLKEGDYKLYFKNLIFKTEKSFEIKKEVIGSFKSTLDNIDEYYLAKGGTKQLEFTFDYPDKFDKTITYTIDDDSIISINDNVITGLKVGTTNLHATLRDGNSKTYKIIVTDLIQAITLNNNKQYLPCKRYTNEQAHTLDKILESRVKEAGVGTRGGVVAAARFITMEFPYQIRYFNENGRLVTHGVRPYVDGEGRYYHKGLYLSEDKYKDIKKSTATGPKIWGCQLYDQFISKMNMNGFTCSGFVSWAMLNGGFDVGDVGAGDYKQFNDDLSDLGPHHEITNEYMKNGNYKVGDFIARNGHAALIIGISDDTIYTAESLPPKLKVYIYGRYTSVKKHGGTWNSLVNDDNLTYVIEMSNIYPNGDGWYTNMW